MGISADDWGLLGAFVLVWPLLHDIFLRFQVYREKRKGTDAGGKSTVRGALRAAFARRAEAERNAFSIADTVATLVGTAMIVSAIGMKIWEHLSHSLGGG
jgi:hypothetical protein